jgi:hypothetical protein
LRTLSTSKSVSQPFVWQSPVLTRGRFVNPIALAAITWKYYAVYIAIDICYFILIYFYFPETKGLSMEEVSLVFDYSTKEGRKMAAQALERATHDAEIAAEGYKGEKHGEERLESVPSIRS